MLNLPDPLAPAETVIFGAMAEAMQPAPPVDFSAWAKENIEFGNESPFPGNYDPDRFPFFRRVLDCLSPDHEAREVTLRGPAQVGKTVLAQIFVIGGMDLAPCGVLYVHPTLDNAKKWSRTKFDPMRRKSLAAQRAFGQPKSRDDGDTVFYKEERRGRGFLQIAGANSPSALSMISTPRVILDDLAKWPTGDLEQAGDAESMAVSRASGFEEAKIFRLSTPLVTGACRITSAWERGTAEVFELPCPHCGVYAPLDWENFRRSIRPEHPEKAHFTCESCGCAIEHRHKTAMLSKGRWKATNPKGDHPSFHIWRAYSPTRTWESIAREWIQAEGVADGATEEAASGSAAAEQVFYNDVLGLPYEQASSAPPWLTLSKRGEASHRRAGTIPTGYPILTAGVDCQEDRTEVVVMAWGREARSAVVDQRIIPHPITSEEGWAALDELVRTARWRNEAGRLCPLDLLAIDEGDMTSDVLDWARRYPRDRVITVKGSRFDTGPLTAFQKGTGRHAEQKKRKDKKRIIINGSRLKGWFYTDLKRDDPDGRGYVDLPKGLDDEFYRQMTAERRETVRTSTGVLVSRWKLVEATRRNEVLDCCVYARAAALMKQWRSLSEAEWEIREEEADAPVSDPDLFDVTKPIPASPGAAASSSPPEKTPLWKRA